LKRVRLLEEENRKLKQLVADLSLDKAMLQEVVAKSSEACPETHLGLAVARALWGQHAAGIADRDDVVFQLFVQGQSKGQPGGTNAHA
jgi:hypothetical protein